MDIFWQKYRQPLSYLFFGGLTTLLNIVLYAVFQAIFGYTAANSWGNVLDNIICILFAYCTNRTWVFGSRLRGRQQLWEFARFAACRLGTMAVDQAIMLAGGSWLGAAGAALLQAAGVPGAAAAQRLWGLGVKVLANVVVILLNYLFSKTVVFRKQGG